MLNSVSRSFAAAAVVLSSLGAAAAPIAVADYDGLSLGATIVGPAGPTVDTVFIDDLDGFHFLSVLQKEFKFELP